VPHRDLYEKKTSPPSNWNFEHKWFFLPDYPEEPPQLLIDAKASMPDHVLSFTQCILDAIPDADIVSYEVLSDGYVETPPNVHACGEYSIEAIIKKR
jgi:hypothetical protein